LGVQSAGGRAPDTMMRGAVFLGLGVLHHQLGLKWSGVAEGKSIGWLIVECVSIVHVSVVHILLPTTYSSTHPAR
jgi:hypothetical protein